ncbi:MAG: hypothetical protein Q4G07_05455 [Oscillospiraceae bacterium]|nr:hypothetical protein [Oscillospiraceae bacterium]
MKKSLCIFLAFLLMLPFCSCAENTLDPVEKTLYAQGLQMIAEMDELLRSDAGSLLVQGIDGADETVAAIQEGDYTAPQKVYKISAAENIFELSAPALGVPSDLLNGASENLKKSFQLRLVSTYTARLNLQNGNAAYITSTLFTCGKTFICAGLNANLQYLYVYETGYPVLIAFGYGEDKTASAGGMFILNDELDTGTAQAVEDYLNTLCTVPVFTVEELPQVF